MKYLVILPAFNEVRTISEVITEARRNIPFADFVVINDGSRDGTEVIAERSGATVISHPFNLGYGAALQTGFRYAAQKGYDFIFTMDADGQHIPSSVNNLVDAMREQKADVVIGSRFIEGTYSVGLIKKIGIRLFSCIARIYTGVQVTDPTSGFQMLNRNVFSYLAEGDNYPLDYPDVNIITALHKKKFRIVETPVVMVENKYGKSMHSGLRPVLYVVKMLLAIIMVLVRRVGK